MKIGLNESLAKYIRYECLYAVENQRCLAQKRKKLARTNLEFRGGILSHRVQSGTVFAM
jgi:hypothetical protein